MTGREHQVFPAVEFTYYHTNSSQTLRLRLDLLMHCKLMFVLVFCNIWISHEAFAGLSTKLPLYDLCLMKMRLRALHPVAHGGIKYAKGWTSNSF